MIVADPTCSLGADWFTVGLVLVNQHSIINLFAKFSIDL